MEDDEEYVEMVREAFIQDDSKDEPPSGPSIKEWSEFKDGIADIVDEIRMLRSTVAGTVGATETPKFYQRPKTLMMEATESARITKRRMKHESLVNKLVPTKRE